MSPGLWRRTALIRSGVWETSSRIRLVPVGFQNSRQVRDTDFEIVGDGHLHCKVTHRHATKTVTGWAGPGHVPDGFVHNRRFGDTPQNDMIRHIRDMVFAARL
jgi:hypothetical protein